MVVLVLMFMVMLVTIAFMTMTVAMTIPYCLLPIACCLITIAFKLFHNFYHFYSKSTHTFCVLNSVAKVQNYFRNRVAKFRLRKSNNHFIAL